MPSMTNSTSPTKDLPTLLSSALPFLRNDLAAVDPSLPSYISTLSSVGAGECWHKHGTFLAHLCDVYRILTLWSAPSAVALCGLFHSAYSNSYVNLAIFDPSTSRDYLRQLIGHPAERLVHLFCVINRQTLIHDDLLFHYSDQQLVHHLAASQLSVHKAKEGASSVFDSNEEWRKKVNELLPSEGRKLKHIKTGEDVALSRRVIASFLLLTMADFSDQLFGFQDQLFDNENGRLEWTGNQPATSLWPGDGRPGLWLNSVSRMGALYMLIVREEELHIAERNSKSVNNIEEEEEEEGIVNDRDEEIELVVPPVFDNCTKFLDAKDQIEARDLYWEAVYGGGGKRGLDEVEGLLFDCIAKNPFVGEPYVVLGQVYLGMGRFEEAEKAVEKGLKLVLGWGSGWDKRVSWEGFVAWARVLLMKAREKDWPQTSWGVLNLGLVK